LRQQKIVITNCFFRFIDLTELKEALDLAGFKVPGWRVRDMIDKYDREPGNQCVGQRKLSFGEFEHVSRSRKSINPTSELLSLALL
jgi:plastin-3